MSTISSVDDAPLKMKIKRPERGPIKDVLLTHLEAYVNNYAM